MPACLSCNFPAPLPRVLLRSGRFLRLVEVAASRSAGARVDICVGRPFLAPTARRLTLPRALSLSSATIPVSGATNSQPLVRVRASARKCSVSWASGAACKGRRSTRGRLCRLGTAASGGNSPPRRLRRQRGRSRRWACRPPWQLRPTMRPGGLEGLRPWWCRQQLPRRSRRRCAKQAVQPGGGGLARQYALGCTAVHALLAAAQGLHSAGPTTVPPSDAASPHRGCTSSARAKAREAPP